MFIAIRASLESENLHIRHIIYARRPDNLVHHAGELGLVAAVFGVDAEDAEAERDPPEQLPLVEPVDLARRRVEEEVLVGRGREGLGPIDMPRNVDAEGDVL